MAVGNQPRVGRINKTFTAEACRHEERTCTELCEHSVRTIRQGDHCLNILILGSTGGTGRELVRQALEQGHTVTAFARDPAKVKAQDPKLRVAQGNILDPASLEAAIGGQDAVLSGLGSPLPILPWVIFIFACEFAARFAHLHGWEGTAVRWGLPILGTFFFFRRTTSLSRGTANIIAAMEKLGVKRLIFETAIGVGDSRGQRRPALKYFMQPVLLRGIFADKEVVERLIRESALEWTIVRPPALTNGPRTGKYRGGIPATDRSIGESISRADVADFMLQQLGNDEYVRKTPGVSY